MPDVDPSPVLICQKCGYSWEPRTSRPKECPDCKNRQWAISGRGRIGHPRPIEDAARGGGY